MTSVASTRESANFYRGKIAAMDDELRQILEAMQRDNASAHAETRRHFDIVAEELRHELRIVAEGVGSLSERITAWKRRLRRSRTTSTHA